MLKMNNLKMRSFGRITALCVLFSSVLSAAIALHAWLVSQAELVYPPQANLLMALLTNTMPDIDRICAMDLSQNKETIVRIRQILQENPEETNFKEFIAKEFGSCRTTGNKQNSNEVVGPGPAKIEGIKAETSPCKMHDDIKKEGPFIRIDQPPPSFSQIEEEYPGMVSGGLYPGPQNCSPERYSTLFILPYRDREMHLRYWLHYMIKILLNQKLRFQIIVVEQEDGEIFNKGQLMNTGFKWALANTEYVWDCVVFHDVDLMSELYGTVYKCKSNAVIHFAGYINKFNYSVKRPGVTVGGAVGFSENLYQVVNGYSNVYWGWGGEDDDMHIRLRRNSIKLVRYKPPFGRYKMIPHGRDKGNPVNLLRHDLLKNAANRMVMDGLSNLATEVIAVHRYKLFTKLVVKVNQNTDPPPHEGVNLEDKKEEEEHS